MKTANGFKAACKRITAWLFILVFLANLLPPFEISLFPSALAAGETIVTTAEGLKAALEEGTITTIYLGANINLREYGMPSGATKYENTSTTSNAYTNTTGATGTLMSIAPRSGGQLTICGTHPTTKKRYTYTDRRTNDQGAIPLRLPNTAITFTFKDIDIYGYNYYGLLYGDSARHTIVFDGVYGVMSQFLHNDNSTVVVRDSIMKTRDTGLRTSEEFFECANVRIEGKTVFDDQSTDNTTMFYVKDGSNRTVTFADNADVTLIERGYNTYGTVYPAGNSVILGEGAKVTSIVAEPENATPEVVNVENPIGTGYTTGYNFSSTTQRPANQSYYTFSGSEAHASVTIGKSAELTIIHPYSSSSTSYDILRTTTSAGITVNEGGILSIYSNAQNSRVLNTSNLILNNPRMVTLYTASSNNYMFNGTIPVKASKLKSIRYYNAYAGFDFSKYDNYSKVPATSGIGNLKLYALADSGYDTNRANPNMWFFQSSNSFDFTSANINGTGGVSNSTYAGTTQEPTAAASLTSANLNASTMHVVQIDGDYSRRPTIDQAGAGETEIKGTGVTGARVNLYGPDGKLIGTSDVVDGKWAVPVTIPLVARETYSATQQAVIVGATGTKYYSSPSGQVTMTVNAKTFRLIATNNTDKSYMTGYLNAGFNSIEGATFAKADITEVKVIIFNNPDTTLPANTDFGTTWDTIGTAGTAYEIDRANNIKANTGVDDFMSVGREIPYNCKVWARAEITINGTTTYLYDTVSWKNLFTPYTVFARAVIAGSNPVDRIYIYEPVKRKDKDGNEIPYGIPREGDGITIYDKPNAEADYYDSVELTAASLGLSNKDDLVEHWRATVGPAYDKTNAEQLAKAASYPPAKYELKLDTSFYANKTSDPPLCDDGDLSKYTLNYVKKTTANNPLDKNTWEDITVKYVNEKGELIGTIPDDQLGTIPGDTTNHKINIPLMINSGGNPIVHTSANNAVTSFHSLGGRYTPPSGDGNSPIGWYVDTSARNCDTASGDYSGSSYTPQSDFGADSFNPVFNGDPAQVLYVVYSQSMFQVTEEYYRRTYSDTDPVVTTDTIFDTPKVQYFSTNDPGNYIIDPKHIGSSVPIGWEIWSNGVKVAAATDTNGKPNSYTFSYTDIADSGNLYYNASATPVSSQYDIFPKISKTLSVLNGLCIGGKVTIKYIYATDTRNNGIADDDEAPVTVRWRGHTVDGSMWTIQTQQTIYRREAVGIRIPNTYEELSDVGNSGDAAITGNGSHTILNTVIPNASGAKWIFDESINGNAAAQDVAPPDPDADPPETKEIFFDYAFASNGTDKDKDQYVTESFKVITDGYQNGEDIYIGTPSAKVVDTRTYVLKNSTYSKQPPEIPGYLFVGYKWDDNTYDGKYYNETYQNGMSPSAVRITASPRQPVGELDHTIIFLYRPKAEGSVTVTWTGKTYAGGILTFNTLKKTGYVGENINILPDEMAVSSGWNFDGSYKNATAVPSATSNDPLTFKLDDPLVVDKNQTGEFRYKEDFDEVTITAKYVSDDNSLDFTQTFPKTLQNSGDTVTVAPFTLGGYELTGWVIQDSHGNQIDDNTNPIYAGKSLSDPVELDTKNGSQTIIFSYRSTITSLYIRCYDASGQEIPGTAQKFGNVKVGDMFYANAPAVKIGTAEPYTYYELQASEPMSKSIQVTTGTNVISFHYKEITGTAFVIMQEDDNQGRIIGYESFTYGGFGTVQVPAPLLDTKAYYSRLASDKGSPDQKPYNGSAPVTFYYTKIMQNVTIQPVDTNGDPITGKEKTIPNAARAGEMYEAVNDITIPGYTLTDAVKKKAYAKPNETLVVEFTYKADEKGDVNVIFYHGDDNTKNHLGKYTLNAVVGSKLTINAETFAGFTISAADAVQEVDVKSGTQTVYFKYTDLLNVVFYEYKDGVWAPFTPPVGTPAPTRFFEGTDCVIDAPFISDYLLYGSTTDVVPSTGNITPVAFGTSQIDLGTLADPGPTTVYLCYMKADEAITDQFVTVTVRGKSGSTVLYEYTVNRLKNGGSFTAAAMNVFGYTLTGSTAQPINITATTLIEFEYTSNATTVTIKAQDEWGIAIPVFTDIIVPATIDQPFSYNAPYIPGWELDDTITKSITPAVAANDVITFTYKRATGNVTVILREDNGRIIKTTSETASVGGTITGPSLASENYTGPTPATAPVISLDQPVVFTYTKQMRDVQIVMDGVDLGDLPLVPDVACRIGEVASFTAPVPPDGYKLTGAAQVLELITAGGATPTVTFFYAKTTSAELVINAEDEGRNLLYTYTLTGTSGQSVTVPAPYVPGYVLKPGDPASQTKPYGSTLTFEYVKNTSIVTVKLMLQGGGDITYLAPAGFATTFETEKGKPCTVVAPNIPGYVLTSAAQVTLDAAKTQSAVAADRTVTFTYRPVDTYVTHTVIGMDSGAELYRYSFLVKKGSGDTTYTAAVIHNYNADNSTNTLPNNADGTITFNYTLATEAITVYAKSGGATLSGFPIEYNDGVINETYSVRAPYVAGYALADGQALYQAKTLTTNSASKVFEFEYVALGDVTLQLLEPDGKIIKLVKADPGHQYTEDEIKKLLETDHYEYYDEADVSPSSMTNLTSASNTPAGTYTFYYKKVIKTVTVKAVDAANADIFGMSYTVDGRLGEMCKVTAVSITGYTLVGSPTQTIHVDPLSGTLTVTFKYVANPARTAQVTGYYMSGGNKNILYQYTVSGSDGTSMEISAFDNLPGWELNLDTPGEANPKVYTFDSAAAGTVGFRYVKREVTITVVAQDDASPPQSIPGHTPYSETVQAGVPVTITPPSITGYILTSPASLYTNKTFTAAQTITFTYKRITTDGAIAFIYKDTKGRQLGTQYVFGVVGETVNIADIMPTVLPFDDTNYTPDLPNYITVGGVSATTVKFGTTREVVLTYKYSGVVIPPGKGPGKGGTVTIQPENPVTDEWVTGTITPDDGYDLAALTITDSNGDDYPYEFVPNTVPPTPNADGTYTFKYKQPAGGVTIKATYRSKGSNSVVVDPSEGGSATVNPANPAENTPVTITLTPSYGYKLKSVTVTAKVAGNNPVTVDLSPAYNAYYYGSYTATYTQPSGGAIVDAVFEKITPYPDDVIVDPSEGGSVIIDPNDPGKMIITPNTGYDLDYVTVNNSTVTPSYNGNGTYTITKPANGSTVHAVFVPSVIIKSTQNGKLTVDNYSPLPGTLVTVIPTPDNKYRAGSVTVTGKNGFSVTLPNPDGSWTYSQPHGGVTITGTFVSTGDADSTIDIPGGGGTATVSPSSPKPGDVVTVLITPDPGKTVDTVTITDRSVPKKDIPYTLNYIGNGKYEAVYIQPDGTVDIEVTFRDSVTINQPPSGQGGITLSPVSPNPTDTVTVTVTPLNGYKPEFVTVTDKHGNKSNVTLTDNGNGTWSGSYVQPEGGVTIDGTLSKEITVTLKANGNGIVRISPVQPKYGDKVYVITTPGYEYVLTGLTITPASSPSITPYKEGDGFYSYTQPDENVTIEATFERSSIQIKVENGYVTMTPANPKPGEEVTLTFAPNPGYLDSIPTFLDGSGQPVTITPMSSMGRVNGEYKFMWPVSQPVLEIDFEFAYDGDPNDAKVKIVTTGRGLVAVDNYTPTDGNTVTISLAPETGYVVDSVDVVGSATPVDTPTRIDDRTYTYTQRDGNATIYVNFVRADANITIKSIAPDPVDGTFTGTVTLLGDDDYVAPGQEVSISVAPKQGYTLESITIQDSLLNRDVEGVMLTPLNIPGTSTPSGAYTGTYIQPDPGSKIIAVFKKSIKVNTIGSGITRLSTSDPSPGEAVTLTITPNYENTLGSLVVGGEAAFTLANASGVYTYAFIQPLTGGTVIDVTFVPITSAGTSNLADSTYKNNAKAKLLERYNQLKGKNYTPDQKAALDQAYQDALDAIDNSTTKDQVDAAKNSGIDNMNAVEIGTGGSNLADSTYKNNAKAKLLERYNQLYSKATTQQQKDALDQAYQDALDAIDNSTTKDQVDSAKTNGIDNMNAVDIGTGGSNIADSTYKNNAKAKLLERYNQLKGKNYTPDQKAALDQAYQDALDAIDNSTTKDQVDAAKNDGIDEMNAVPVGTGGSGGSTPSAGDGGNTVNPTKHGRIIIVNGDAKKGETVIVYVLPEDGYELDTITIKDGEGNDVPYVIKPDGTISFVQPESKVTIAALFKPVSVVKGDNDVSAFLNTVDHTAYVSGRGNGVFAPDARLTRAEAAQLFYDLLLNKNVHITNNFSDVSDGAWYAKAVNVLASLGVVKGLPDGRFEPDRFITRAEFVTIAVKFAKVSPCEVRFSDVSKSHWAYIHISTAVNYGWISSDVGLWGFAPNREITRAEAVSLVNKVLGRTPDRDYIDSHSDMKRFSDVSSDYWAYYDIMEAANAHDYKKNDTGETWK